MRLTTKGHYAVTAMLDLALHEASGPVTLAAISLRQHISLSYLEQLFSKIKRQELIESTRGPGGGYSLGRDAASITVADIILSVDGPADFSCSGDQENCGVHGTRCLTHKLWEALNAHMLQFLQSVTLQSLVEQERANGIEVEEQPVVRRAISRVAPVRPIHVDAPNSVFAWGAMMGK
ncbi:MAG: Rrf2 family transcriptional regulator [Burkholderiaceae bacterium]|nr:MAG: Rrf2 family transcriptional regulator [Burkholderiaceae bacterium]